jgi:hypothetical protein
MSRAATTQCLADSGLPTIMFTGYMIRTDVGLFLKDLERKVAQSCLMVTLHLVDGKQAVPEALGMHIFLNPLLNK